MCGGTQGVQHPRRQIFQACVIVAPRSSPGESLSAVWEGAHSRSSTRVILHLPVPTPAIQQHLWLLSVKYDTVQFRAPTCAPPQTYLNESEMLSYSNATI